MNLPVCACVHASINTKLNPFEMHWNLDAAQVKGKSAQNICIWYVYNLCNWYVYDMQVICKFYNVSTCILAIGMSCVKCCPQHCASIYLAISFAWGIVYSRAARMVKWHSREHLYPVVLASAWQIQQHQFFARIYIYMHVYIQFIHCCATQPSHERKCKFNWMRLQIKMKSTTIYVLLVWAVYAYILIYIYIYICISSDFFVHAQSWRGESMYFSFSFKSMAANCKQMRHSNQIKIEPS